MPGRFIPGLPGQGMHLAADPLSLCFLALILPQIAVMALARDARSPCFSVCAAGMVMSVLAGDAFTLVFGFGLMNAASWLLVLRGGNRATAHGFVAILASACLVPAMFLPAGGMAFCLVLLGAGATAGLPFWPGTRAAMPLSGGMAMVALYIIIRYGFVVMAAAPWWGAVMIGLGAAGALRGAVRACLETDMKTVLSGAMAGQVGLITVGLGVALRARAIGDPALACLALQAALLGALAHGLVQPLLALGADAVKRATGTTDLNGLGGLMRGMPRLGGLLLAGAAGWAALPPGPGFAPQFLLAHAVIQAAAGGGVLGRIGFAALLAVLGIATALTAVAALRWFAIACLGRPRTLNAAGAEEAGERTWLAMAGLAGLGVIPALMPGLVLRALAPVIAALVPDAAPAPLSYAPLPLAVLLLVAAAAAWVALRRLSPRGVRPVKAWNGGFGAAPAWLPFGDPLTQPSASGFFAPLRRALGGGLLPVAAIERTALLRLLARMRCGVRRAGRAGETWHLAILMAAFVIVLLAVGLGGG